MANVFRFISEGHSIDFKNDGSALAAGAMMQSNALVGLVTRPIGAGEYGSITVSPSPIVEGPLDTGAAVDYQMGETVYYNLVSGYCQKTAPGTGFLVGHAVPGAKGVIGGYAATDGCANGGDSSIRIRLVTQ